MTRRYVVMGACGCGKSTVGARLAAAIGGRFVDGDTLHSEASIAKMARGVPLDDDDRWDWLDKVGQNLRPADTVIACSALKRAYRDRIAAQAGAPVTYLYLKGSREMLLDRMSRRDRHYMPVSLLDSQIAILEEPGAEERAVTLSIEISPEDIVTRFLAALNGDKT